MITIYHLRRSISADSRWKVTGFGMESDTSRATAAMALFLEGGYEAVAEVDGGDLEFAYAATQNGVMSDSWSRLPPKGVRPLEPAVHVLEGNAYGRKSSEIGDIFEVDGHFHVVDTLGFAEITGMKNESSPQIS